CLQNMMTGRIGVGIASALGAASADAIYAIVMIFGLQAGQSFLNDHATAMSLIAGIILCILGLKRLLSKFALHKHKKLSGDEPEAFFSVFFLALIDPVSMIDFMALCVGLAIDFSIMKEAARFVAGMFLGSATWWFSWCLVLVILRKEFSFSIMQWIARMTSVGILGFGLWMIYSGFRR
ncbi:MAG TPA: LysE family transporter, partial [Candidatus Saccharimonadales bacterium]|nr:LysE family transporter [Candidatus Saccharimonadales bacterium]